MLVELALGAAGYAIWRSRRRRDAARGEAPAPGRIARFLLAVEQTGAEALDDVLVQVRRVLGDAEDPAEAHEPRSEPEQQRSSERRLLMTTGTLGTSLLGATVAPALLPVAGVGMMTLVTHRLELAMTDAFEKRRFGLAGLDAAAVTGMFVLGQFVPASAFGTVLALVYIAIGKTRDHSRRELGNLFGDMRQTAWRLDGDGIEVEIPLDAVRVGDRLTLRAGEPVPVDGVVLDGVIAVDQRALTGEEHPIERAQGDPVLAGTLVQSGVAIVEVRCAGRDTVAAKVVETLLQTSDYRSELELKGLRIAEASVTPTLAIAGVTWLLLGPISATAVFLCSVGYQMRVSGPLTVLRYLRAAASRGILVKDGRVLEQLGRVDTIVFDKTGTLTELVPTITAIHCLGEHDADTLLAWAAAAEHRQSHPIALAIQREGERRGVRVPPGTAPGVDVGLGVRAEVEGRQLRLGSHRFMDAIGLPLPAEADAIRHAAADAGRSLVWIAVDDRVAGAIELGATMRPDVPDIIRRLRARGLSVIIMSGDHEAPTRRLAAALGVDGYLAEVMPTDKSAQVDALRAEGRTVCFVGDGINDAIALKRADVSISLRDATSIAVDTAQIVVASHDLSACIDLLEMGKDLEHTMQVNFAAATVPGVLNVAGVYLLHTGIAAGIAWSLGGLTAGALSAATAGRRFYQRSPSDEDEDDGSDRAIGADRRAEGAIVREPGPGLDHLGPQRREPRAHLG